MRIGPRTQNLAILLSDMKGFTARTSRQTREENERMLAMHDALLLPVIKGFGGQKVKSVGDGVLVTFRSPTDCVLCGMAIQDRLAAYNVKAPGWEQIEVRITISLGEVRVVGDDIDGDPVQLALKASNFTDAGEVVLTEAVYLAMNKSEVPTEPFPARDLRPGETRLHRARIQGLPSAPYGARALKRLGRLPAPRLPLGMRVAAQVRRGVGFVERRWPWVAIALLLLGGGSAGLAWASWRGRDPMLRAAQLLAAKAPLAALAELDKLNDSPLAASPRVALLRGKAEQSIGQLGMAFSDFTAALDADPRAIDAEMIQCLVDDLDADAFPLAWRPALVRILGERIGPRAEAPLRALLQTPRTRTRRDALDALELMGKAKDEDRIAVAQASLSDRDAPCSVRLLAVKQLAIAGTERARSLLQDAADADRCGSREAQDALRRLSRAEPHGQR